jgi:hypothetical protein
MSLRDTNIAEKGRTGELGRYERNRFFYGKLMTARDMQTEQTYHASRLEDLGRVVAGNGIVCGLEASVTETVVNDTAKLEVTIDPGYALDAHGRPVVVKNETSKYLDLPETSDISLFLTYEECLRETVPVPDSGDACKQECAYNRVLEVFEVTYEATSPDVLSGTTTTHKPVPDIRFPSQTEVADDEVAALDAIARSYYESEAGELHPCETDEASSVFLGVFTEDGGDWVRAAETAVRPHVYTNDMLYAALTRHATDFDNPHAVNATQVGSPLSVEGVHNPGGNIGLDSPDETVSITPDDGQDSIGLDVSASFRAELDRRFDDLQNILENRLDTHENRLDTHDDRLDTNDDRLDTHDEELTDHEDRLDAAEEQLSSLRRYVMDKTLKYKLTAFSGVSARFESKFSEEIARETKDAIDNEVYTDVDAYRDFIEEVADLEGSVSDELSGVATAESLDRYDDAVKELDATLDGKETILAVAAAQDRVCEAAEWLRPRNFDIEIPDRIDIPEEVFIPSFTPIAPDPDATFDTDINAGTTDPVEYTGEELAIDPRKLDTTDLEAQITAVTDETQLRETLAAEMDGPDRLTARETIEEQLETVTGETTAVDQPEETLDPAAVTVDPRTVTVSELESEIKNVTDETELKTMLNLELTDEDRTTAKSAIETQLRNINKET